MSLILQKIYVYLKTFLDEQHYNEFLNKNIY